MKVLLTGAAGQLGRALLASLPPQCQCVALTRDDLDLLDRSAVRAAVDFHKPDLLINAAAYTAVDRAEAEPEVAFAVNAAAVGELAAAAHGVEAHFVQISSDYVFDGSSSEPYAPDASRNPISVYGRSKAAGEDAAGPEATIIRTAWLYGAEGHNFVNTMLRVMREQDEVRVVTDQIGSPTWVRSLAPVVWELGLCRISGTWHHTDAGVASWYDFACAIEEEARETGLLGKRTRVVPITSAQYPTAAERPRLSLLDCVSTRARLCKPAVHWQANLRTMLVGKQLVGSR